MHPPLQNFHRNSAGLESVSTTAPPPCYTSQINLTTATATHDHLENDADDIRILNAIPTQWIENEESILNRPPSLYQLPSPYSSEDLRISEPRHRHESTSEIHRLQHPQTYESSNPSCCTHGYAHIHSHCDSLPSLSTSYELPSPALRSSVSTRSRRRPRLMGHTSGSAPEESNTTGTHVYDSSYSHGSHLRHPSTIPSNARLGIPDSRNQVYGINLEENHLIRRNTTFVCNGELVETNRGDAADIHFAGVTPNPRNIQDASLTQATKASRVSIVNLNSSVSGAVAPSLPEATNYVNLFRKSTIQKSSLFAFPSLHQKRRTSITGSFVINPLLHVPSGLLRSMAELGVEAQSSGGLNLNGDPSFPLKPSSASPKAGLRKNLKLEVENGGIDVDIHLVGYQEGNDLQRFQPSTTRSDNRLTSVIQRTQVELCLKEAMSGGRARSKKLPFHLIARIDAPEPRPPFHLFATTIPRSLPFSSPHELCQSFLNFPPPHTRKPSTLTRTPSSPRQPLEKASNGTRSKTVNTDDGRKNHSAITLHLPLTFRGPLSIYIAAGDIDAHVSLSRGLEEAAVVLTESACARGYFVGGLWRNQSTLKGIGVRRYHIQNDGLGDHVNGHSVDRSVEEYKTNHREKVEKVEEVMCGICGCFCRYRDGDHGGEEVLDDYEIRDENDGDGNPDPNNDSYEQEEWVGDRVDVVVGNGKVCLQFLGEKDPFGRDGWFWTR